MNKRRPARKSAFSLLEISITILIIGILLIGVIGAKHLIKKSRITTAQNLTLVSPIVSIADNDLWLESSLDYKAFSNDSNTTTSDDSGNALGDGDYIENWNNNSYNQDKIPVVKVGNGPTYANTINNVQAVKFAGSDDDYLEITDASFLNNTDYTIFVLEKRLSNSNDNYFIGDSSVTTDNETLVLGYNTNTSIIHSQGSSSSYNSTVETYANYSNKPRLFTFSSDSAKGKKTYINGTLASEDEANISQLSNITSLSIGKGYDGEIGEIVIFTRALKTSEIKDVEDYISKKWNAPNNRDSVNSCLGGTVTVEGCIQQCQVNVVGSSDTTPKDDGESGAIACNQTGYDSSDTISYTCSNGTLITGTCDCDSGYALVGGECVNYCSVNVTGSTTTSLASGSTSVSCDVNKYAGTYTFSACSAGNTVTGTCECATGYTGAGCTACDIGYSDYDSNGTCEQKCTITGESGITDGTLVESGTTSLNCNDPSATSGTITYTCSNGSLGAINNTCVVPSPICSGGNIVDTTTVSGQKIHIFTSSGTLTCSQGGISQVLVVAGGGSGGSASYGGGGGGGGAGGIVYSSSYLLTATSYSVTIGNGGASVNCNCNGSSGTGYQGNNGGNSQFGTMIAQGGGGGGMFNIDISTTSGSNGGSGGGGGGAYGSSGGLSTQTAQTNETSHHGNNGGLTSAHDINALKYSGGGGGGAGGVGGAGGDTMVGGAGGSGMSFNITGSSTYYSGGGGGSGGVNGTTGGVGGSGGGGAGGKGKDGLSDTNTTAGTSATANTGSGGGGASNKASGAGGSGIVIVRYANP